MSTQAPPAMCITYSNAVAEITIRYPEQRRDTYDTCKAVMGAIRPMLTGWTYYRLLENPQAREAMAEAGMAALRAIGEPNITVVVHPRD